MNPVSERPTPEQSAAGDRVTYGPVYLDVTDAGRSLAFWRDLIGLRLREKAPDRLVLGVDDAELLGPPSRRRPSGAARARRALPPRHPPPERARVRLRARPADGRHPQAPTDHVTHWATYLDDPDGIGLELSFETIDRFGHYVLDGGPPGVIGSDGRCARRRGRSTSRRCSATCTTNTTWRGRCRRARASGTSTCTWRRSSPRCGCTRQSGSVVGQT